MSQCEYWDYAKEAMLMARQSKQSAEIKALEELAHVWAMAALQCERDKADETVRQSDAGTCETHFDEAPLRAGAR